MGIYMGMWLFARWSGAYVGGFPGDLAELNRRSTLRTVLVVFTIRDILARQQSVELCLDFV